MSTSMNENKFYVLPQSMLEHEKTELEKRRIQNSAAEALVDEVMYWRELGKVVALNYPDIVKGYASAETVEDLDEAVSKMQRLFDTIEGIDQ